jgi:hypothetical protein
VRAPVLAVLLAALSLFPTRQARAETPVGGWYGWQIALADAAALGLTLAPVDLSWRGATATVGLTALFINGPVINMVHGHAPAATRGLLRLPAFLLGRLIGFGAGELFCAEGGCKAPLLTAGSAFGLGTVVVLDLMDAFQPAPWYLPEPGPPNPLLTPPPTRTSPLGLLSPGRGGMSPRTLTLPLAVGRF